MFMIWRTWVLIAKAHVWELEFEFNFNNEYQEHESPFNLISKKMASFQVQACQVR